LFERIPEPPLLVGGEEVVRRHRDGDAASFAARNSSPMWATVSLSRMLSPNTGHETPSGLRKSTCGSVMTSAACERSSTKPDAGNAGLVGLA
jgi:hypothetical protein